MGSTGGCWHLWRLLRLLGLRVALADLEQTLFRCRGGDRLGCTGIANPDAPGERTAVELGDVGDLREGAHNALEEGHVAAPFWDAQPQPSRYLMLDVGNWHYAPASADRTAA